MRTIGAFELHIEPSTGARPMRVSLVFTGAKPNERGVFQVTPDCMRLDELESCINALQDELDVLRAEARRVFTSALGHA